MENGILSFGGSWTEEKLEILRKYLRAYTTALKKQRFNLIYIDALAGTGYCGKDEAATPDEQLGIFPELMEQDAQAYIEGSARIALQIELPFERYIYIDLDPKNCARLHDLKAEYPDRADRIEVVNADANDYILQLVQTTDWANTRAVMFLDPYGMEVGWDTVRWVASSKGIDLWYLFPISAVNRMRGMGWRTQQAFRLSRLGNAVLYN
jgi:three-Cys-motif partner protein